MRDLSRPAVGVRQDARAGAQLAQSQRALSLAAARPFAGQIRPRAVPGISQAAEERELRFPQIHGAARAPAARREPQPRLLRDDDAPHRRRRRTAGAELLAALLRRCRRLFRVHRPTSTISISSKSSPKRRSSTAWETPRSFIRCSLRRNTSSSRTGSTSTSLTRTRPSSVADEPCRPRCVRQKCRHPDRQSFRDQRAELLSRQPQGGRSRHQPRRARGQRREDVYATKSRLCDGSSGISSFPRSTTAACTSSTSSATARPAGR